MADLATGVSFGGERAIKFFRSTITNNEVPVQTLTAIYGPAASSGMGSAVFTAQGATADTLMTEAMAAYRHFVGESWDKRKDAWEAGFEEIYRRAPGDARGIDAELHALQAPALRGAVQMMVDEMEDPTAARAALAEAFDGAGVSELRIYSLGDGEQMAGLQVAALREGGEAVLLVMLLD